MTRGFVPLVTHSRGWPAHEVLLDGDPATGPVRDLALAVHHREPLVDELVQGTTARIQRPGRAQIPRSCMSFTWRAITFSRYSACFIGARFR